MTDILLEKDIEQIKLFYKTIVEMDDASLTEETIAALGQQLKDYVAANPSIKADMKQGVRNISNVTQEELQEMCNLVCERFGELAAESYCENPIKNQLIDVVSNECIALIEEAFQETLQEQVTIKFEKVVPEAQIPKRAHATDAGADLYAIEDQVIKAHTYGNMVRTGLKMEPPEGWTIFLFARSGMSKKTTLRISNSVGVIDNMYRNEVMILFDNVGDEDYTISKGDRVAQMLLSRTYNFNSIEVEHVNEDTERGLNGLGSSGK